MTPGSSFPRLSSPSSELRPAYEVVVVGSGYGGAIVAARLAQQGFEVCVLERGAELRPGEYPKTPWEFVAQAQAQLRGQQLGRRDALTRFVLDDHQSAVVGCALGGTSIINAGVALRPPSDVWLQPRWPEGLRNDPGRLEKAYASAEAMLRPTPSPIVYGKGSALAKLAAQRGNDFVRAPLAVHFGGPDAKGREPCNGCGECVTGCNRGSKNTLLTNYLPHAVQAGASVICSAEVRSIARVSGGWRLSVRPLDLDRERFQETDLSIDARMLVLSAGSLGSTEILLRSAGRGLPLSAQVGERFSGNGTLLGFTVGATDPVGAMAGRGEPPVGPTIEGMLDLRSDGDPRHRMIVQDTAVPPVLRSLVLALLRQRPSKANRLLAYSVTAGDAGVGRLLLENDRLRIRWPDAGRSDRVLAAHEVLRDMSDRLGGRFEPNPVWASLPTSPLLATHPLGGCGFGEDATAGVVNHRHQVFAGATGAEAHPGLFVCDGSVIPGSFDSNPMLTLSALAERCASLIIEDTRPVARTRAVRRSHRDAGVGLRFTERMTGYVSPTVSDPAPVRRPRDATPFSFLLTVAWPNMEALFASPDLEASTVGTVHWPEFSPEPLTVAGGTFKLFVGAGPERRMMHRMELHGGPKPLWVEGYKLIRDDPGPDLWFDTSTLFVSIRDEERPDATPLARGLVQTRLLDLMKQVTTIQGVGAKRTSDDFAARARFLRLFLGTVRDVYGGLVLPLVR